MEWGHWRSWGDSLIGLGNITIFLFFCSPWRSPTFIVTNSAEIAACFSATSTPPDMIDKAKSSTSETNRRGHWRVLPLERRRRKHVSKERTKRINVANKWRWRMELLLWLSLDLVCFWILFPGEDKTGRWSRFDRDWEREREAGRWKQLTKIIHPKKRKKLHSHIPYNDLLLMLVRF